MANYKKMINIFIGLGLIGGILIAVSIAGYRIYSGKANAEKEQKAIEQREGINDNISSVNEDLSVQIESSKSDLLEQQNESKNHIIEKIDETSKTQIDNQDKILDKLEDLSSHTYKPLNQTIKQKIIDKLIELKSKNKFCPALSIEIESGNSQRHKVALELESILTPLELGCYGKGNTSMGRFPDYPISFFTNSENLPYVKELSDILSTYISEGIVIRDDINFPKNFLRIYINGTPEFYTNGTIKVN